MATARACDNPRRRAAALANQAMKIDLNLVAAVLMLIWGLACVLFPQLLYKKVSPEQMARDRKRMNILGYILLALGAAMFVVHGFF